MNPPREKVQRSKKEHGTPWGNLSPAVAGEGKSHGGEGEGEGMDREAEGEQENQGRKEFQEIRT